MYYLFLAGIGNSEPEHWQSIWFRALGAKARWVEHADWDSPAADRWVGDLERATRALAGPKVLVAHSLGCLLAIEWAKRHRDAGVKGSFLVAPPDVNGPNFPKAAIGFGQAAAGTPPLPALVVASADDPYASFDSARAAATAWGAELANVGRRGHINLASNIAAWDEGRALLDRFVAQLGHGHP